MTSVSGTGDLHVDSSLTVTQCPKMSQRSSLWLGTKLAAMQHTVWVCRSILHPKRLGLSAEAWEVPLGPSMGRTQTCPTAGFPP